MNDKKIEKEVYEIPVIIRQQVILEQVIAAGSPLRSSDGAVTHEWNEEDIDNGDVIVF
ncbi:MAG: hypothetical protein LUI85_03895 [Bacteroides sp.]|nr:hypothetical protein [Bacteroides sp.]